MEVQPVWEAKTPLEAEQTCEALRAQGIKCDYTEILLPSDLKGRPLFSLTGSGRPSLYVVVAGNDADRADAVLQAREDALQQREACAEVESERLDAAAEDERIKSLFRQPPGQPPS